MAASCSGARAGGASLGWEVPFDQDDEMMTTNIQRAQAQTCRLQVPNQCILATLLTLLSLALAGLAVEDYGRRSWHAIALRAQTEMTTEVQRMQKERAEWMKRASDYKAGQKHAYEAGRPCSTRQRGRAKARTLPKVHQEANKSMSAKVGHLLMLQRRQSHQTESALQKEPREFDSTPILAEPNLTAARATFESSSRRDAFKQLQRWARVVRGKELNYTCHNQSVPRAPALWTRLSNRWGLATSDADQWQVCYDGWRPSVNGCLGVSIGVGGEFGFEDGLVSQGCTVHAIDPTDSLRERHRIHASKPHLGGRLKFHYLGLGGDRSQAKSSSRYGRTDTRTGTGNSSNKFRSLDAVFKLATAGRPTTIIDVLKIGETLSLLVRAAHPPTHSCADSRLFPAPSQIVRAANGRPSSLLRAKLRGYSRARACCCLRCTPSRCTALRGCPWSWNC